MYMAQKAKKKSKLRHAEYYDMQKTFDSLYADSKSGEIFGHLRFNENGRFNCGKSKPSYLFYPNFIFPGTVRENIVCGRKISNTQYQELETVLQLPPADKQVTIKPENLSLGEKQKIYLARTLLGNSSCILLDEPGSNLDEKTEHSLINHLLKLKEKKLILVISHNAYYDAVADRTYEIRKGIMHQVQSH